MVKRYLINGTFEKGEEGVQCLQFCHNLNVIVKYHPPSTFPVLERVMQLVHTKKIII